MDSKNPLDAIENLIATDSRDWCEDYRSAMIYIIVFGFDDDGKIDEAFVQECRDRFNFTEETLNTLDNWHKEWVRLKNLHTSLNPQNNNSQMEIGGGAPTTIPKR